MDKILIVGYGVTGYNMHNELLGLSPDLYDINKKIKLPARQYSEYDFIFICVDTPYTDEDNPCDITQVENVINEWKSYLTTGGVFIIKSTILPSLIDTLSELNDVPIVYSPEYYGGTQHCNNFEFNFTILGGEGSYPYKVQQLLQKVKDARHTFRIVDPKTACLTKYMENCYLAMKVSFCLQFFEIAKEIGVNYEDLRELFILDPRVNPSHTFVYRDKPYWDSHCLNKDVRAIAGTQDAELLKNIIDFNNKCKNMATSTNIEKELNCSNCEHYFKFVGEDGHCSQKRSKLTELKPCKDFKKFIKKEVIMPDNKTNTSKTSTTNNNGRPKPMVPKTTLKKNGNRYKCGGKLQK